MEMKHNILNFDAFEAVIFDMDGVLIDSEPVWKIAMEAVFKSVGCMLTKQDFALTAGMRLDEVIAYWYNIAPWPVVSPEEVVKMIIAKMIELLSTHGKPLTGVIDTLKYLKQKGLKIGLATSSYEILIDCVLKTLDIKSYFEITHSAEHEDYGKPHPAVYLSAAAMLKINPAKCLVIEDSLNGIIAGKAARMTVVCIPEKTQIPNPKMVLADAQFEDMLQMLNAMKN